MKAVHRLEPVWWLLFGAGGFAGALVLPALFFMVAIAFPLGFFGDPLTTFLRMRALFANPIGQVVLLAVLALTFWHAAHHLRHFALDLGFQRHEQAVTLGLYAFAALASLGTALVVLGL